MVDSINNNPNAYAKSNWAGELGGTVAFGTLIQSPGAVGRVLRGKGIKGAVNSLEIKKFKELNLALKNNNVDVFTRNIQAADTFDILKSAQKNAHKLAKQAKKTDISLWEKFLNLFRKAENKKTIDTIKKASKEADKYLQGVEKSIEKGIPLNAGSAKKISDSISAGSEVAEAAAKAGAEAAAKTSAKETVKGLFKSELTNKFVLAITLAGAIPRIKDEVLPTFKEKGFIEGIKATGKVIARTGVDFVSNAGFSAVGRAIGTALGSVVPGIGNVIGGTLGDMIGSFFSMKLTSKIFDKEKPKDDTKQESGVQDNTNQTTQQAQTIKPKLDQDSVQLSTKQKILYSEDSLTGSPALDAKINKALTI